MAADKAGKTQCHEQPRKVALYPSQLPVLFRRAVHCPGVCQRVASARPQPMFAAG